MRGFLLLAFALTVSCPTVAKGQAFDARARALDGDSVAVDFRLLGVDAFERGQLCERADGCWQCGKAAQDLAATSLRARTATIRLTTSTTYGRPVAVVTVNGEDLGERLIRAGLAVPEPQYLRDDPARAARYAAASDRAQAARAGAYVGHWIKPSSWRQGERLRCERRDSDR